MTEQEIINNAPDDWTHYGFSYFQFWQYWKVDEEYSCFFDESLWNYEHHIGVTSLIRCRKDIERIAELEANQVKRDLEQQAKGMEWVLHCPNFWLSESEIHALMNKIEELHKQAKEIGE